MFTFIVQLPCSYLHIFYISAPILLFYILLTLSRRRPLSYRNQSIGLQSKSGLRLERVNGDLFNALLLYWHFCLHSNITYDNLWIFRVGKKKKKIAHIVGNNNAKIFLLASWYCCYRFEASISWLVAVFFAFWCYYLWSLIYSFQSLVYIQ